MKSNNIFLHGSLFVIIIILVIVYFHTNVNLKLIEGHKDFARYGYKTVGYYGGNGYEYPLYFMNDYPVSYPLHYLSYPVYYYSYSVYY